MLSSFSGYTEGLAENSVQHETLMAMLGWTYGYDLQVRPLPSGYAGTTYSCNLPMKDDLRLQSVVPQCVLTRLHMHAILCLHNIMKATQYLEKHGRYAVLGKTGEVISRTRASHKILSSTLGSMVTFLRHK